MSVTAYISYFRSIAMLHKLMLHDEASEAFDAFPSTCHFRPYSVSEDFSVPLPYTIADGYSLHLNMYGRDLAFDQAYAAPGIYPAGFIITRKVTGLDADAAMQDAATIAGDVIQRIMVDSYDAVPTLFPGQPNFKKIIAELVGPIWGDRYGCRVSFPYTVSDSVTNDEMRTRVLNAFNEQIFERQFEGQFQ